MELGMNYLSPARQRGTHDGELSKHVNVSIKAWKDTNPSIQACEDIDIDIGA